MLERFEHVDLIYENKIRIEKNKDTYHRRQAIVEHPYGIIKRQWGFYYIMTKKSIKRASADVGLILTAYNLRRIMNIIGHDRLRAWLKTLFLLFGLFLNHFKTLWRIQISTSQLFCTKVAIRISMLMHTFIADYSPKTTFEEGY
jgi:hypothetical protein